MGLGLGADLGGILFDLLDLDVMFLLLVGGRMESHDLCRLESPAYRQQSKAWMREMKI